MLPIELACLVVVLCNLVEAGGRNKTPPLLSEEALQFLSPP